MEERAEIKILLSTVLILLIGGSFFYAQVENLSTVDAFYMSVITLSTVGYGDLVPQTNEGKIFTSFYILIGVGVLLEFLNVMTKRRVKKTIIRRKQKKIR
jgi:hypothetical protein